MGDCPLWGCCAFSQLSSGSRAPVDESTTSAVPEPLGDAAASGPESLECPAGPALPCGLSQDQEAFRKLGLTKEVLAAHTQKEEQSFLLRFREIRKLHIFQSRCHHYPQERPKGHLSNRSKW